LQPDAAPYLDGAEPALREHFELEALVWEELPCQRGTPRQPTSDSEPMTFTVAPRKAKRADTGPTGTKFTPSRAIRPATPPTPMSTNRRTLLGLAAALAAQHAARAAQRAPAQSSPANGERAAQEPGAAHRGPAAVASGNGLAAAELAFAKLDGGMDPLDAVVAGVTLVENDPADQSVGLGGLPNEDGVVQLDASLMHGPSHRAGAVAALEGIQNPAQVALLVLKRTRHVMLVGAGAKAFALAHGFAEVELLTDTSRAAWLAWKARQNPLDNWLDADQQLGTKGALKVPFTTGTVHCSAVDANGDLGAVTSTSGLSWKIPGRVGDSPIVGAGMYVDNAVGSAGATGLGEAVIQVCGAFSVVRGMEDGLSPTDACLAVLRRIADRTRRPYLLDADGKPNFQVVLYALRKDGAHGSASLLPGGTYAVRTAAGGEVRPSVALF